VHLRWLWAILGLALALRLAAFAHVARSPEGWRTDDGVYYHLLARNLQQGQFRICFDGLEEELPFVRNLREGKYLFSIVVRDQPTNYWSPGYPAFVALIYTVFGPRPGLAALAGVILGTASCALLWRIMRRLASPGAALLGAGLLALHPVAAARSPLLEAETLGLFLLLAALDRALAWREAQRGMTLKHALLLGVLFAALFYVRSTFALLPLAWGIALLVTAPRRAALPVVTALAVMVLALLPWGWRNQQSLGRFMILETRGAGVFYGEVLHKLRLPYARLEGETELERWGESRERLAALLASDYSLLPRLAAEHLRSGILPFVKRSPLLLPLDLLLAAGIGWGFFLLRGRWREWLPAGLFLLFYSGSVLLLIKGNEARFRLPAECLAGAFLAVAVHHLWNQLPRAKSHIPYPLSGLTP